METAVERAVRLAGGQSALARAVGVTPQAVQQWVTQGRISYRKVIDVERVTGVPRYELRPDLYPAQEDEAVRKMEEERGLI